MRVLREKFAPRYSQRDTVHPENPIGRRPPTAEGAHHFVFSPDRRYAFVQNSLMNLPGLSDGSVTVVDLEKNQPVGRIDALQKAGFNPNCIILLPKWSRDID